jgi:hypothetical protein
LLDEYLDGLSQGTARAQAEARIAADPEAAEEVRLQGEIDRSLKRLFAEGARAGTSPVGQGPVARIGRPVRWFIGTAAALLLGMLGVWAAMVLSEAREDRLGPLYQGEVASGFVPQEVCTTAEQFADWTKRNYGEAVVPAEDRGGVTLVGWSYGRAVSGYSGVLLARVDGTPVVVVLDRAREEGWRKLPEPEDRSLHAFRRRIGDLVLYEVTPLPGPRVLPLLSEKPGGG